MSFRVFWEALVRFPRSVVAAMSWRRNVREKLESIEKALGDLAACVKALSQQAHPGTPAACGEPTAPATLVSANELAHPLARAPGDASHGSLPPSWGEALLGQELADDPQLAEERTRLLLALEQRQESALGFLGYILLFRSSPAEELPRLLQAVGEAYYRFAPRADAGPRPLERALADWVQRTCLNKGIRNRICLVEPGDRFDTQFHYGDTGGPEVREVHGWVVRRDDGTVYSKAKVVAR